MDKLERINYLENKEKKINEFKSEFWVNPLEKGFANTIGNALRRTLLSSITSVAAFAVKINNVLHEFETLDGLTEDISRVLLNIRQIKFKYIPGIIANNEIITVSFKGNEQEGHIIASDLVLPAGIEIINPEQLIATTTKAYVLKFEIFIHSGRGYVDFEDNNKFVNQKKTSLISEISNGEFLAIDSDFSPIVNVQYSAIELNNESARVQERLILNIKTNGTVTAKLALAQASQILMAHLSTIANVENLDTEEIFKSEVIVEENSKLNSLAITDLDLSIRSLNALKRSKHFKVIEVAQLTLDELRNIKNLGEKSVTEIVEKLKEHGISLSKGDE